MIRATKMLPLLWCIITKMTPSFSNYSILLKEKNLEISSLQSRDCEIRKNARYLENTRSRDLEIKH